MTSKTAFQFLLGAACALGLSSCFETEQEFTLNPDGSGKVRHKASFQNMNLSGEEDQSEDALKQAVVRMLKDSKGVEAWKDVSYKRLDDGRISFEGTAYFKDLSKVDLNNQVMLEFSWKDGVLELDMDDKKGKGAAEKAKEEKEVNLKAERAKYAQSKAMMSAVLGGMKQNAVFVLPGKPGESSNFATGADGRLELEFTGAKLLEVMDKLVADDAWLAERGFESQEGPAFDDKMCGMLFGEEGPVRAKAAGGKPLFDYAEEVAAAKLEMAELMKKLGEVPVAPAAKGEDLEEVRVVGVRYVEELDKKLNLRPFYQEAGWTLCLYAKLPGSILDVTGDSVVEIAEATDGSSLLKGERDWDLRLKSPKVSKDKSAVLFEVELLSPGEGVKGLKELSGLLQYRVSGKTKEVDLGFETLAEGEEGQERGAVLKEVNGKEFSVKVRMKPDDLVNVWLVVDGEKSELEKRGYGSSNGVTTFNFEANEELPEKGSVIMELHDELQVFDVPFKVENIDLLGKPLK